MLVMSNECQVHIFGKYDNKKYKKVLRALNRSEFVGFYYTHKLKMNYK